MSNYMDQPASRLENLSMTTARKNQRSRVSTYLISPATSASSTGSGMLASAVIPPKFSGVQK